MTRRPSRRVLAKCASCGRVAERQKQRRGGIGCVKKGVYCGCMHVMEWLE